MSSQFRIAQVDDGPAIGALLAEVFHHDPSVPRYDARQYHWKFWQERADFPGSRSFVLARGNEILAHAGVVPGRCVWPGGQLRTLHLIDWVAKPSALGAGGVLLRQIIRTTDALLAIGGSADTRAIMPALGFKPCGEAIKYQRTLRPARQWASGEHPGWRAPLRIARDTIWTVLHPTRGAEGWQARPLAEDQLEKLPFPLPLAVPEETARGASASSAVASGQALVGVASMERSVAMMRYMLSCPATSLQVHGLWRTGDEHTCRGYFVLAWAGPRSDPQARLQARLADAWIDSDKPEDWTALVHHAVAAARQDERASEIVALTNRPEMAAALTASGFRGGPPQPVQLLLGSADDPPARQLLVQMLDNDAAWIPSIG